VTSDAGWRGGMRLRDARSDRDVAALLEAEAFTEIHYLVGDARRTSEDRSPDEDLDRIRFLADLAHTMPGIARPDRRRPSRRGMRGSRGLPAAGGLRGSSGEQAMAQRPMSLISVLPGSPTGGSLSMLRQPATRPDCPGRRPRSVVARCPRDRRQARPGMTR
jgi:hypothetical protein